MLSYAINKENIAEILMTNGGPTLKHWKKKIINIEQRMNFIVVMIKQIIPGLQKLHSFGYSHGDLKPDNICARVGSDGTFKFTLIDLGVASKIPKIGEDTKHKSFRGNFMYSSPEQIA